MAKFIKIDPNLLKNQTIRRMPTAYKLFWVYLMTNCDQSGVWIVDWDEASYYIGEKIDPSKAKDLFLGVEDDSENAKAIEFDRGRKWLLPKFANFQIDGIKNNGNWAKSIKSDLAKHGIDWETMRPFEKKNGETLSQPLDSPSVTLSKGLNNPSATLTEPLANPPLSLANLSLNTLDENKYSIISIEGGMGGDSKVAYPMNYWENLYKEFHDAYGPYGYPWKKWDVIENLRLATKTILHEWEKMSINADYTKAGEFLIECAKLSKESDRNAKRDKRKAPHNWLADQNYMTNPHDVAPKQMTESEKLLEAIKKANANRHTA